MATETVNVNRATPRGAALGTAHFLVQLLCRYFIAYQMFSYSSAKLLGTQFTVSPGTLERPIGELTGFELTWAYYGYSYPYGLFIAAAQITAGALLLFRPTLRLGLLLFLAVMGNIVMIDVFYNIGPALPMALLLLAMGLYLFLSDWQAFWSYLFGAPYNIGTVPRPELGQRLRWARFALVPVLFAGALAFIYTIKQQFTQTTPLDGAWDLPRGGEVSRLIFDFPGYCVVRMAGGGIHNGECAVDAETQTVSVDVKQIDIDRLSAEGKLDETTDDATFARLTADSPTAFRFTGSYRLADESTLVLEPQEGGSPIELRRAEYAYGRPYAPLF